MIDAAQLHASLAARSSVELNERADDYYSLLVSNSSGAAEICLHGAQVIQYTPVGEKPLLWLSTQAVYEQGKAVRGGVPVCWPWFGSHASDRTLPAHGFVRNRFWQLAQVEEPDKSTTIITLKTSDDASSMAQWPYRFELSLTVTVGAQLTVELTMTNTDQKSWTCGGALHSYFAVGDIGQTRIDSVMDQTYLDKPDDFAEKIQKERLDFSGEVDRVYTDFNDDCVISDMANSRDIIVEKSGSNTTVIWNPWSKVASTMQDMPDDAYRHFVCVEPANAFTDQIRLAPGETHTLSTRISCHR